MIEKMLILNYLQCWRGNMAHRYTEDQVNFIRENCKGKTTYELVDMFNKYFNTDLKRNQIRTCMQNRHFTSDIDRKLLNQYHPSKYTKEQGQFIKDNITGKTSDEITDMFNNYFEVEFDGDQIRSYISNNGLKSGVNCEFGKGHIPANKGMTGVWYEGSEKTWFKKGDIPVNHREVGSERITVDDYTEVKVAEPNKWRLKQQLVWEKHNGPIEKGYAVIFGDGDRHNLEINNLILVSRQQLLILNRNKLIQNDADLTKTGVIIADLYQKISDRKNAKI